MPRVSRVSTATIAAFASATLSLASPSLLPVARAADAAPSDLAAAALAADRARDRRMAERVVDAFLALSREDQIKVVDRLMFTGDDPGERARDDRARDDRPASTSASSSSSFASDPDSDPSFAAAARRRNLLARLDDEAPAADARDGWPTERPKDDAGDDDERRASSTMSFAEYFAAASTSAPAALDDANDPSTPDADAESDDESDDASSIPSSSSPSTASSESSLGESLGERLSAAATATLRLSDAFAAIFSRVASTSRDDAVSLALAALVVAFAAAQLAEVTGDSTVPNFEEAETPSEKGVDETRSEAEPLSEKGVESESEPRSGSPSSPAPRVFATKTATPDANGVLWRRREDDAWSGEDAVAASGANDADGVLWTRSEDAGARKARGGRDRRRGGRDGGDERREGDAVGVGYEDGAGYEGAWRPPPPPPPALGPVEDENMENIRIARGRGAGGGRGGGGGGGRVR